MVKESDLLWTPSAERVAGSKLSAFTGWLAREKGLAFAGYEALWRWSVTDLEAFWGAVWDYFSIRSSAPHERVLGSRAMPGAKWFPGARLNYAEHILRQEQPGSDALLFLSESAPLAAVSWDEFAGKVRILATRLRSLGVQPGDRVAAYMPNIPETMIAMLAATSIGAIWASCSPDFGISGVLDRLSQLAPKLLFCVDGYRYGGREFDRRAELRRIIAALPSLERVIHLPYLDRDDRNPPYPGALLLDELLDHPPIPADAFRFEQLPFDHPLWILFSSGTTGLPKPIVQGHGGILLEMLKLLHFHLDLRPQERMFFFTTTGWMMWNFLSSSFLAGARPVLYDGNPAHPEPDVLWKMVEDTRANLFGASPTYVEIMVKQGIVPREKFDLSSLRTIMPAGSPVSAECSAWFYDNVKRDLWLATGSGGTDICTGLVGGVPTQPVYAGEIQGRSLGVAAYAFDDRGEPVVGETGELVITEPMPSMPLFFWGDEGGRRYTESYFQDHPGVWRHGDFFRLNERGGCFVLGRSDSTLNRHGVRIGTAEVYRALARLDEIEDALIVNLDLPGGKFFMPLFVKLAGGRALDERISAAIRATLRQEYSPRHVPDRIYQVPAIPMTLTGKKMEVPVRKILLGLPAERAANRAAMREPEALDYFTAYARNQQDYSLAD
ncbi:MAG TPA: acetoacetate--CoA ligase [Rhodocyclaceae bacterium]|nr:acetoacetate--CoA ligase [Rhodocyclaceae bacterium]